MSSWGHGQTQSLLLQLLPLRKLRRALQHAGIDLLQAARDQRVVHFQRCQSSVGRRNRGCEHLACLSAAGVQRLCQQGKLIEFLCRKGKPGHQFRIERRFKREIDRYVQQRRGRRQLHLTVSMRFDQRLDTLEQPGEISAPDIASVDDIKRQDQIRRRLVNQQGGLLPRAYQIDMQARDRKVQHRLQIVTDRAKIGCQHHVETGSRIAKRLIGMDERGSLGI